MRRLLAVTAAAAVLTVTACANESPVADQTVQEESVMSQPRPTLDQAVETMESALEALGQVLKEDIPARAWEKRGKGSSRGCDERTQGSYDSALFLAPGEQISAGTWGRIESVLADYGYLGISGVPLDGGSAFVHFYNDFGDSFTVSSLAADGFGDGGSGYSAKTSCHEGYVRKSDR